MCRFSFKSEERKVGTAMGHLGSLPGQARGFQCGVKSQHAFPWRGSRAFYRTALADEVGLGQSLALFCVQEIHLHSSSGRRANLLSSLNAFHSSVTAREPDTHASSLDSLNNSLSSSTRIYTYFLYPPHHGEAILCGSRACPAL